MLNQLFTGRTRLVGIVGGAAVMALFLADFVILAGDRVAGAMVPVGPDRYGALEISRVGEEHMVEISTRANMTQNSKGRALRIRLAGPDGAVLYEDSEVVSKEQRFFEFVPEEPGTHRLFLEESMLLLGAGGGNASVTVYVNDRRLLKRLYPLLR
jgi:hypothetical protein